MNDHGIDRPSIAELTNEVYGYGRWLKDSFDPADITELGDDEPGGGIRLQLNDGWSVHHGDSSYDQDHRGAWGCGWVRSGISKADARYVATDLISQAMDAALS